MKTTKNQTQKSVKYSDILATNKMYKEQSLFNVLNFLNKDAKTLEMLTFLNWNITKENKQGKPVTTIGLTINQLKEICPDYFKVNSKDKDGNIIIIDRTLFAPFTFLKAIFKAYNAK